MKSVINNRYTCQFLKKASTGQYLVYQYTDEHMRGTFANRGCEVANSDF